MTTVTGATQQIVSSYEDSGLMPDQIVAAFDNEFDLTAVIAVLMQFSSKYREDNRNSTSSGVSTDNNEEGKTRTPAFSEEAENAAIKTIESLSEYAEDESLRGKMAMYIREDRRGRRDAVNALKNNGGTNILQLQILLSKADAAIALTESKRPQRVIDVQTSKVA